MLKTIRNNIGNIQGFGHCYHCKDTWNWKKTQSIPYKKDSFMFPICKECFIKLPEIVILNYCIRLMEDWHLDDKEIKKYTKRLSKEIKKLKKCVLSEQSE